MKLIFMTLLVVPLFTFAQKSTSLCAPIGNSSLDAAMGNEIRAVKSLEISEVTAAGDFTVQLSVKGVLGIDVANHITAEKEHTEIYTVKERKDGSMFELKGDQKNSYDFTSVFIEFGSPQVVTAGPIPPGTYKQIISLAFIDSNLYYKNMSPMKVKKIVFDCKSTYTW